MSARLMSCVRENSPPLQNEDGVDVDGNLSDMPSTPVTQKRRQFLQPLRNLRRMFRRRGVVSQTETASSTSSLTRAYTENIKSDLIDQHHHNHHQYQHHQLQADGETLRGGEKSTVGDRLGHNNLDLERDISDCQRSFSEGRLVDSELSQSHDSVFSESATASSLSIVLKAELTDVLRKRQKNRPDTSDEDLGLPRSPITPQKTDLTSNNVPNEGSLSLLSIISSDLEEDSLSSSMAFGANTSHSTKISSSDTSRNHDEVDLDMSGSNSSRLSHSAARHKMAVRPIKKKGPTRHRRPIEAAILPSTPEVNEDLVKVGTNVIEVVSETKKKSQSLPPGVNSKIIEKHSSKLTTEKTSSTTLIYVNKRSADPLEFEKNSSQISTLDRSKNAPEEEGFFKRLLHRSSKKRKTGNEVNKDHADGNPKIIIADKLSGETEKIVVEKKEIVIAEMQITSNAQQNIQKQGRSGPASRQRMLPQDLSTQPVLMPPKSPIKVTLSPMKDAAKTPPISLEFNFTNLPDDRTTIPMYGKRNDEIIESVSPPKSIWPVTSTPNTTSTAVFIENESQASAESAQMRSTSNPKSPKIYGLSPFQQRVTNISSTEDLNEKPFHRRKSVEKSKSFRFYNETKNLQHSSNLPSLPDLTTTKYSKSNDHLDHGIDLDDEPKYFSFQGPIAPKATEIGDNNLMQIEENIDKIVKSNFVVLKKSKSMNEKSNTVATSSDGSENGDGEKFKDERSRRNSSISEIPKKCDTVPEFMKIQLNRVDSTRPKSHVVLSKNVKETEVKERRFSNENVEITETKPPLPPDVRRNSVHKSQESVVEDTRPNSLHKSQEIITGIRKPSVESIKSSLNDDNTTSVPETQHQNQARKMSTEKVLVKRVSIDENINKVNKIERKSISDDENVVILRRKSVTTNKDDTPELMKVFARRSLKVKDPEDCTVETNNLLNQKPSNLDSDKENQSSSEEKLNKLTKVEVSITGSNNNNINLNNNTENKREVNGSKTLIENSNSTNTDDVFRPKSIIPPKFVQQNRYASNNYRNTTNFIEVRKNLQISPSLEIKSTIQTTQQSSSPPTPSIQNLNNNNNETTLNIINNNNSSNNNNHISSNRHTINVTNLVRNENDDGTESSTGKPEFKNIFQRRAEWEKRAKEGL